MRIGLDAREAFRAQPRGIGLYVRHLLREFAKAAPQHEYLLYHQLPQGESFEQPPRARSQRVDPPGDRFHSWERVGVPLRMARDGLSVYHGTYNTLPPRWPLLRRTPMVVTVHDLIVTWHEDDLQDSYVRYCRAVTPRVLRDADLVLTVSEWSRKDILQRHPIDPQKVRISLNGVHPDFLVDAPAGSAETMRARWADGRPYVFSVGAPLRRKNTARLVEAWGHVVRKQRELPQLLLVSGLGNAAAPFAAVAEQCGIADRVRFLPYVSREELRSLYAGADLSVYPSLVEGWGIPVVESLAMGTPVLTSNTSAMPEAGGRFARYFDPTSTESMAHELERALAARSEFAALRADAVAHARSFTWANTAQSVLTAYGDVAR